MVKKKVPLSAAGRPRLNLIKEALAAKQNLTQEGLARAAEISFASVNMYVNGKREPSLETLVKIAGALELSPRELIIDYAPHL